MQKFLMNSQQRAQLIEDTESEIMSPQNVKRVKNSFVKTAEQESTMGMASIARKSGTADMEGPAFDQLTEEMGIGTSEEAEARSHRGRYGMKLVIKPDALGA